MAKPLPSIRFYILKRVMQFIPLIFSIIVLSFLLIHLAPGDPVIYLVGQAGASEEYMEMMREKLGLDLPLFEQFSRYLSTILRGDLGYSLIYHQPVAYLILSRIPATIMLMGTAYFLSYIIGIFFGVFASTKPYSFTDNLAMITSMIGYAMPIFWIGQILLLIFALHLNWFPVVGMSSVRLDLTGINKIIDILWHMVLPVLCLSVNGLALMVRMTRASMLEILNQDYITTAFSKGLRKRTVIIKHALRNALIPIITLIGQGFGTMIAGAVLTETVFSWPGIGRLTYDSVVTRDYPVLSGILIFISISVLIASLITDLAYAIIDPRIRYR